MTAARGESRERSDTPRATWWLLAGCGLLYAAALNPHFLPGAYDNIVYHFGADTIWKYGTYRFQDEYIVDWPPVFSLLLVLPRIFGIDSVVAGKAIVALTALAATALAAKLLAAEKRPAPLFACFVFALAPTSFLTATREMSDWPCAAFVMLCLALLQRLSTQRSVGLALLVGCAMGAAALTRYAAVLLGVAVVAQALRRLRSWREGRATLLECVGLEALTAGSGAALFSTWLLRLASLPAEQLGKSNYGHARLLDLSPWPFIDGVTNATTYLPPVAQGVGLTDSWGIAVGVVLLALAGLGIAGRIRNGTWNPTDWYVAASAALFYFYHLKAARHVLPMVPFLIGYFVEGVELSARGLRRFDARRVRAVVQGVLVLWATALLAFDLHLLFRGNTRTHGALHFFSSPTAERFYLGEWADLHSASTMIRGSGLEGDVGLVGTGDFKYVRAWSGHVSKPYEPSDHPAFLLVAEPEPLPEGVGGRAKLLGRAGKLAVYHVEKP